MLCAPKSRPLRAFGIRLHLAGRINPRSFLWDCQATRAYRVQGILANIRFTETPAIGRMGVDWIARRDLSLVHLLRKTRYLLRLRPSSVVLARTEYQYGTLLQSQR